MSKPNKPPPLQTGLFGTAMTHPDLDHLPLIMDPRGSYEVFAPGSIYQPVLLQPGQQNIDVGPGRLDQHEEQFVRDLIRYLYPAGNPPRSEKTPLAWNGREVWLKRNIEKDPRSFRLRVDDSDWFYPDFIVWIIDPATRTQTFGFVDPKGLALGLAAGWSDYKIVATIYQPHVVGLQLAAAGQRVEWQGEPWRFRIRGVLVSTSSLAVLQAQAKFWLRDEWSKDVQPDEDDFRRARIVFQQENSAYISRVLELLLQDTSLDAIVAAAARFRQAPDDFVAQDEVDYDLQLRQHDDRQTEAALVGDLIRDYLKPDASGVLGGCVRARRRSQLMDYAREGWLGVGAEKVASIRDHPAPCAELWRRMSPAG